MNREICLLFTIMFITALAGFSSAAVSGECTLGVYLINQDPVHAVPGEYVDVVFQMSGVQNPSCGTINFKITPEYPFSLDPNAETTKTCDILLALKG